MAKITTKDPISSKDINLKTRNLFVSFDGAVETETITVYYKTEKYYLNENSEEVHVSYGQVKNYTASWENWEGILRASVIPELEKEVPGSIVSE